MANDATLKAVYKSLAIEWHPDRHQGAGREEAERRFQEISEAYQTLSDPVKRTMYDEALDAAKTSAEAAQAAKKYRAATWNTEVPDMRARLRNAKKEEAGFPPHIIAGTVLLVTGNFILALRWLGG
jgi:DnaJ-class molecular chaperone